MTTMIIDAADSILGRLTTQVTEEALKGKDVHVINCGDAVITGDREEIITKYQNRRERGAPYTGPHFPTTPKGIVKRSMRGMLPHESHRGIQALKRIKCHTKVPHGVDEDQAKQIDDAHITRTTASYTTIEEIANHL